MAFHVRDPETDRLVRELARKRGIGLTEAIRQAIATELEREARRTSLWERIGDIQDEIASHPKTGREADKAFYDWLSSDEGA